MADLEKTQKSFKGLQKKLKKVRKIFFYKKKRENLGKLIISNMLFWGGFGRTILFSGSASVVRRIR